ncbi:MAG: hypothetical protein M3Q23_05025 [Actinomycetota bacterium]|nr:hypothetical protein [Actinomycetota bacterium]
MPTSSRTHAILLVLLGVAVLLSACAGGSSALTGVTGLTGGTGASQPGASIPATTSGSSPHSPGSSESAVPSESPVPAESNPPGDIPDSTQFVPYRSPKGHFLVKVPEGWSRTTTASAVSFTDKLNTVTVTWSPASSAPTVSSVKARQVPSLQATERAFLLGNVLSCAPTCTIPYSTNPIDVSLPNGSAVVLTYGENSAPNDVTGKQYRLEVVRFDFFHTGEEADLILSGPVGADNVDPWRLVAQSFRWT